MMLGSWVISRPIRQQMMDVGVIEADSLRKRNATADRSAVIEADKKAKGNCEQGGSGNSSVLLFFHSSNRKQNLLMEPSSPHSLASRSADTTVCSGVCVCVCVGGGYHYF